VRLHALVRRARGAEAARLACGPLTYDLGTQRFALDGEPLAMSPRETAVLRVLLQHAGEPMSKQQILERVVSDEKDIHPEAVEVIVHRLRKRVDGRGLRITTYRGLGYALEADRV
jgi:two-component system response regulator TctD